jgi:protein TonB
VAAALGKEDDRGAAREEAMALLVLDAACWVGAVRDAGRRLDPQGARDSRAALDEVLGTGALGERFSGYNRDPATRPPEARGVRAPADFPEGFVPDLLRLAPCGEVAMAEAEVDYGPDGRPVAVRVKGGLDSPCREAVVALARASVRRPDAGPATETLLFPLAADAVACLDGWDETEYAGRVGGATEPPRILRQAEPRYPAAAKARGEEGIVVVESVVTASGCPAGARVLRGATPSLDRAAIETILGWRFAPARRDGTPVAVYFTLTMSFHASPR